jgi:DNA processing protein
LALQEWELATLWLKLLTHCSAAERFSTTAQLAAIDGVGSILLRSLKDKSVF